MNADCVNTVGSYSCKCRAGYTGDGQTCNGKKQTDKQTNKQHNLSYNIFDVDPECDNIQQLWNLSRMEGNLKNCYQPLLCDENAAREKFNRL